MRFARRPVLGLTLGAFLLAAMPAPSYAGLVGTADALRATAPATDRARNLARVEAGLAREDVRQGLAKYGVDPAAAAARVAALDDAELAELAERMDTLPAGGDVLAVVGIVFVVLLILDYTGVVKIFRR